MQTEITLRQAAQQALEALEDACGGRCNSEYNPCFQREVATALRAALAEPEQEPVAWITDGGQGELWWYQSEKFDDDGNLIGPNPDDIPLYTAPTPRKPLTMDEVEQIVLEAKVGEHGIGHTIVRAVERAHGIGEQHE